MSINTSKSPTQWDSTVSRSGPKHKKDKLTQHSYRLFHESSYTNKEFIFLLLCGSTSFHYQEEWKMKFCRQVEKFFTRFSAWEPKLNWYLKCFIVILSCSFWLHNNLHIVLRIWLWLLAQITCRYSTEKQSQFFFPNWSQNTTSGECDLVACKAVDFTASSEIVQFPEEKMRKPSLA